jgi:hypothetical protein
MYKAVVEAIVVIFISSLIHKARQLVQSTSTSVYNFYIFALLAIYIFSIDLLLGSLI